MARGLRLIGAAACVCSIAVTARAGPANFTIISELQPARPLKPGEFTWDSESTAKGELTVVVDLKAQLLHVYRGGREVGLATIASGRRGYETPAGVFAILEKNIDHYSDSYDLAPMPYMQRLTWDGVALHGGKVPGHPVSHGCVRVPEAFAHILFFETRLGGRVIVSPDWAARAAAYDAAGDADPADLRLQSASE